MLLAGALPPAEYDPVSEACAKLAAVVALTRNPSTSTINLDEGPEMRDSVEKLLVMCRTAREILRPLAYGSAGSHDG